MDLGLRVHRVAKLSSSIRSHHSLLEVEGWGMLSHRWHETEALILVALGHRESLSVHRKVRCRLWCVVIVRAELHDGVLGSLRPHLMRAIASIRLGCLALLSLTFRALVVVPSYVVLQFKRVLLREHVLIDIFSTALFPLKWLKKSEQTNGHYSLSIILRQTHLPCPTPLSCLESA